VNKELEDELAFRRRKMLRQALAVLLITAAYCLLAAAAAWGAVQAATGAPPPQAPLPPQGPPCRDDAREAARLEVRERVRAAARAECCPSVIYHAPPPAPVFLFPSVPLGALPPQPFGGHLSGLGFLPNRPARAAGVPCGPTG